MLVLCLCLNCPPGPKKTNKTHIGGRDTVTERLNRQNEETHLLKLACPLLTERLKS